MLEVGRHLLKLLHVPSKSQAHSCFSLEPVAGVSPSPPDPVGELRGQKRLLFFLAFGCRIA